MGSKMFFRGCLVGAALAVAWSGVAHATVEVQWWHAMAGELGRKLENLTADFNGSQTADRTTPVYKWLYTETRSAAIVAMPSRQQPAIVQVAEVATATMMAAKGAVYPVFELMRDAREPFEPAAYLPAIAGYYTD